MADDDMAGMGCCETCGCEDAPEDGGDCGCCSCGCGCCD